MPKIKSIFDGICTSDSFQWYPFLQTEISQAVQVQKNYIGIYRNIPQSEWLEVNAKLKWC